MKILYDFPYFFFNAYHAFWRVSIYNMTNLIWDLNVQSDKKNTSTKYETCLKLKLKNKYTITTFSNGVLLSLLLTLNVFLSWFLSLTWNI